MGGRRSSPISNQLKSIIIDVGDFLRGRREGDGIREKALKLVKTYGKLFKGVNWIKFRGIGAIGSARALQARGTGIETQILHILRQ